MGNAPPIEAIKKNLQYDPKASRVKLFVAKYLTNNLEKKNER
jgi:hypothetical protein